MNAVRKPWMIMARRYPAGPAVAAVNHQDAAPEPAEIDSGGEARRARADDDGVERRGQAGKAAMISLTWRSAG